MPSSGNSFSRASGSSGTINSNGATSTRVSPGTLIPAACASVERILAGQVDLDSPLRVAGGADAVGRLGVEHVRAVAAELADQRAQRSAPRRSRVDSFVHRIELSNDFDSARHAAARARSAVASTNAGTLPGPTPSDGLPE